MDTKCAWCKTGKANPRNRSRKGAICDSCMYDSYTCTQCDYLIGDGVIYVEHVGDMCESCYENGDYFQCDRCDQFYSEHNRSENDDNICVGCEEPRHNTYRSIDLKTKEFQSEDKGEFISSKRLFGVELEVVNNTSSKLVELSKILDKRVGVAHDGSIRDGYGIEIQTPILQGAKGEKCLVEIADKIKSLEFKTNNSCGTHCHIDAHDFLPTKKYESITWWGDGRRNEEKLIAYISNKNTVELDKLSKSLGGKYYRFSDIKYTGDNLKLPELGLVLEKGKFVLSSGEKNDNLLHIMCQMAHKLATFQGNRMRFIADPNIVLCVIDEKITHKKAMELLKGNTGDFLGTYMMEVPDKESLRKIKTLMTFYLMFDDIFLSMMHENRRLNDFAKPLKDKYSLSSVLEVRDQNSFEKLWYNSKGRRGTNGGSDRDEIKDRKQDPHDSSRYVGVNFHSLVGENGTLEIRYHSGTTNSKKILSWVSLHQRIMDMVAENKISIDGVVNSGKKIRFEDKLKEFFSLLGIKEGDVLRSYVEGRINTYNK